MRFVYNALLYLLLPFAFLRLLLRSRANPAYRRRWGERLALFPPLPRAGAIWVHAVSVGETVAAAPLIEALLARYPKRPLLVTTTTPTGSERVRALFGERVCHVYLPYDLPGAVRRFLDRAQPALGLVMETELWPNLYREAARRGVSMLLLNARLSPRSARGYGRIGGLVRSTLRCLDAVAAQSPADAERFLALGAAPTQVSVTGNLKFDLTLPPDLPAQGRALRAELGAERPVWIAASTHEGEDEQVLAAHRQVRAQRPEALLILVPRHPERFDRVAALCREQGLTVARRSRDERCAPDTTVYLGDTMGELLRLYAAADLAFVGGSLVPTGGHNLLEPAALGLPVLTGPQVFNFRQITDLLLEAEGARVVADAKALAAAVSELLDDTDIRRRMGERAQAVVAANRGALDRCLALVAERLPPAA